MRVSAITRYFQNPAARPRGFENLWTIAPFALSHWLKFAGLIFSLIVCGLFAVVQLAQAQGQAPSTDSTGSTSSPQANSGQAPAESPVGVIPEAPPPEAEEPPQITLKLTGTGCDLVTNEAEFRRVKGVLEVDVESDPGHIIVYYDGNKTTKQLIKGAVGKKTGGCVANEKGAQ